MKTPFSLDGVREIWSGHLGFTPTAFASFDHITTGLPSRILVGYRRLARFCAMHGLDEFRAVSVVLDNIIPARETPCGISGEFGVLSNDKTLWVGSPQVFYFRNTFAFDFEGARRDFEKGLSTSLNGTEKGLRLQRYRDAMGWYALLSMLWGKAENCEGVITARRDLLRILGSRSKAKQRLHSSLFPVEADVLEYVVRCGFDLNRCPYVEKTGIIRLVEPDGTEGSTVYEWDSSIPNLLRGAQAVPTAPMAILASCLAFPNFGNDYGMRRRIAKWLGVERDLSSSWGDGKNSWPVGVLRQPRSKEVLHSLWADLIYWGSAERYLSHVERSLETGQAAFDRRLCDWTEEG